jgi:hypothetical protein
MRRIFLLVSIFLALLVFSSGCKNPQTRLRDAKAAENTGDHRQAANLYGALVLRTSHTLRLHEASKGKMLPSARWLGEINKYIAWLTETAAPRNDVFREALDGLARAAERFDADNTASAPVTQPLETLPAFTREWNNAFNPPPTGETEWTELVGGAFNQNFSVLRIGSPRSYVYDISVVSRKNARRVNFTLFSESHLHIPLPPGEYAVVLRSNVSFQQGKMWISDFTLFDISVPNTPSLISMDLRTSVARRE